MIELVIVMLILGILAGVAAPRYTTALAEQRAEAASRRLAADIALARRQAIRTSTPQSIEFSPGADSYRLPGVADLNRPNEAYEIDLTTTGYPVDLVSAFGAGGVVRFDIYGLPDATGAIEIASGAARRTVTLDTSGNVSVN